MVARASRLFPDDRQRTLLRAALLPGPGAREAWRAAAAWLDPARIDPGSRQLLPLVWANLTGQGIHDPALEPLAGFYRDTRVRVEALLAAAARPLAGLRAAGIPTLVLKGGALVSRYYCDTGLRPMSDLDVLVPTPAAPAAQQVLQDHGWSPRFRWSALGVRMTHAAVFDGTHEAPVDLHWHVFAECCRPDADASLWERSIAIEIGGVPTRALSPADQLLHVCVHGDKWVHVPGIRWVADAVTVMRAAAVIDWEHLVQEATRRRFVVDVYEGSSPISVTPSTRRSPRRSWRPWRPPPYPTWSDSSTGWVSGSGSPPIRCSLTGSRMRARPGRARSGRCSRSRDTCRRSGTWSACPPCRVRRSPEYAVGSPRGQHPGSDVLHVGVLCYPTQP